MLKDAAVCFVGYLWGAFDSAGGEGRLDGFKRQVIGAVKAGQGQRVQLHVEHDLSAPAEEALVQLSRLQGLRLRAGHSLSDHLFLPAEQAVQIAGVSALLLEVVLFANVPARFIYQTAALLNSLPRAEALPGLSGPGAVPADDPQPSSA